MLPRIEYSVVVPVSAELAFRAFQDFERLLHRGIYEEASWTEGEPWRVGSRIRYVVSKPVKATISSVVTTCEPPIFIGLLNHSLGVTAEQQVFFAVAAGGCRVRMTLDFVGKSPDLTEEALKEALTFVTHDALDTMSAVCQQWKSAGASL